MQIIDSFPGQSVLLLRTVVAVVLKFAAGYNVCSMSNFAKDFGKKSRTGFY